MALSAIAKEAPSQLEQPINEMSTSGSDTEEEAEDVGNRGGRNAQDRVKATPGSGATEMRLVGMGNTKTMNPNLKSDCATNQKSAFAKLFFTKKSCILI